MSSTANALHSVHQGATAIISHRVKPEHHVHYQMWLEKVDTLSKPFAGFIDRHVITPIAGKTQTFTVILRFDTAEHLHTWLTSSERRQLIDEVKPYLLDDDNYHVQSGLEFLFQPLPTQNPHLVNVSPPPTPKLWKQFLLTWSAIFPLVTVIFWLYEQVVNALNVHPTPLIAKLIITGLVVFMMVYVVMPRYTKLVKKWLLS